jgi:hypothetical protein
MISSLPTPQDFGELHKVGGRIGAHNIHENEPEPGSAKLQNTGGLDMVQRGAAHLRHRRPYRPGGDCRVPPETPTGQRGSRISDVFVDDRSIVYAADRANGGLYVLEYQGKKPLN